VVFRRVFVSEFLLCQFVIAWNSSSPVQREENDTDFAVLFPEDRGERTHFAQTKVLEIKKNLRTGGRLHLDFDEPEALQSEGTPVRRPFFFQSGTLESQPPTVL
jgi:hypothetical protein